MKRLERVKDLLIVVDMVNGFVKEGVLADPYISRLIPSQKVLIEHYLDSDSRKVAFVKEAHTTNSKEFKDFPPHCIIGTDESELVDELIKYEGESLVYPKNSTSAVFAPNFMDDIAAMRELKRVLITGCCTDICVMNLAIPLKNYFNQNDEEVEVYVPRGLSETYEVPGHDREEFNNMAYTLMNQAGVNTEMPNDLVKVLK